MTQNGKSEFRVEAEFQPIFREIGLDADGIYQHPDIKVWRSITERDNCTLDAKLVSGRAIRLHIKRYKLVRATTAPAEEEAQAIRMLETSEVPALKLVGWGKMDDGRSFLITEDLTGYEAADKLVRKGMVFERIAKPIAELAAKLHRANLHHRDLYLCHFFVRRDPLDIRLIDAARVKRLPGWPFRMRWIVKDLAQLWYSMIQLNIPEPEMQGVIDFYAHSRKLQSSQLLLKKIKSKAARIARHDAKLTQSQPTRNISLSH